MEYRDYTLPGGMQTEILNIPKGFEIVDVQRSADHRIRLTALVDNQQSLEPARFKCIPSGADLSVCRAEGYSPIYLGTVQMLPAVWHVHELRAVPSSSESPVVDDGMADGAIYNAAVEEEKEKAEAAASGTKLDAQANVAADAKTSETESEDTDSNPFNNK